MSEPRSGRNRSLLAQERSRDTRKAIIKAALELWSERGYDTGVDDTTAEEIAARAGVSKATFYLHFARKEDILLETAWVTTKVFQEDAVRALARGWSADQVIDDVTVRLCRRMDKVPRPVLRRILRAQANSAGPHKWEADSEHFGFQRVFALIFGQAQESGDMPRTIAAGSLGGVFEAMLYESLREWAHDEEADLLAMLRLRFAILLAGARYVRSGAFVQFGTLAPGQGLGGVVTIRVHSTLRGVARLWLSPSMRAVRNSGAGNKCSGLGCSPRTGMTRSRRGRSPRRYRTPPTRSSPRRRPWAAPRSGTGPAGNAAPRRSSWSGLPAL